VNGSWRPPKRYTHRALSIGVGALFALASQNPAYAQRCEKVVGTVVSYEGSVEFREVSASKWLPATADQSLCAGTLVRVGAVGRASILLDDHTLLRLAPHSTLTIPHPTDEGVIAYLKEGMAHFMSRVTRKFNVVTPYVNAGIEGTEFLVAVSEGQAQISVFEGLVRASNEFGEALVAGGERAVALSGKAPVIEKMVRPFDGVEWALYYPPLDAELEEISALASKLPREKGDPLRGSLDSYRRGEYFHALQQTQGIAPQGDAFHLYRGTLYLLLGSSHQAEDALKTISPSSPHYVSSLAQLAILKLARNDLSGARELSEKAHSLDSSNESAALALSYTRQAEADIRGAVNVLLTSSRTTPLVHARLAELYLGLDDSRRALQAAEDAVQRGPQSTEAWRSLGFVKLSRGETEEALKAFHRAREIRPSDPLVRLGIGLAKIREGDLKAGRRDIEIAVNLDPSRSLLRSYLAKAYYEEKRNKLASKQLEMAKQIDARDPTPYLYKAILELTRNRPVIALQDIRKSIERNAGRYPYRSRELIAKDLASRSTSLARIYDVLGFDRAALAEGWKATSIDPTDYSSHQFLANAYVFEPRQEVARVSEQLQAQLLQPLMSRAVPVYASERNLSSLQGGGPMQSAWNEYTSLFEREKTSVLGGGRVGSNGLREADLAVAQMVDRVYLNAGYYHGETDGFRENNDQKRDIFAFTAQTELTSDTSVLAEYRQYERERGDIGLRFDPEQFRPHRNKVDEEMYRLGIRHRASSRFTVLGTTAYQERSEDNLLRFPGFEIPLSATARSVDAELQGLYSGDRVKVIGGASAARLSSKRDIPLQDDTYPYYNGYLYSHYSLTRAITLIGGVAVDHFESTVPPLERDEFAVSPKLGAVISLSPSTTLRAAAFQSFKREIVHNQTLEPTHVAGFNQLFDEVNGTRTRRAGVALDHKFSDTVFGGLSASYRDARVIFLQQGQGLDEVTNDIRYDDWDERELLGYLHYAWHPGFALSFIQRWTTDDRDQHALENEGQENFAYLETALSTLRFSHHAENGIFSWLQGHWYNQDIRYYTLGFREPTRGSDGGVIADIGIGYRLPRRLGLLSLEVRNVGDTPIQFQERDYETVTLSPDRSIWSTFRFMF